VWQLQYQGCNASPFFRQEPNPSGIADVLRKSFIAGEQKLPDRAALRGGAGMAQEKDAAQIVQTIAQSIRVSQRGARRVRAHRFKELFGYQVLTAPRREKIEKLMAEAGIEVRPSLEEAERDDWLVMSIPVNVPVTESSPDPAPKPEWFAHMASVHTDSEREVEMHFASPLFRDGLGYGEEQEAAGFGIQWARGNRPGHVEADLLYSPSAFMTLRPVSQWFS
jgi:hypothetical protein